MLPPNARKRQKSSSKKQADGRPPHLAQWSLLRTALFTLIVAALPRPHHLAQRSLPRAPSFALIIATLNPLSLQTIALIVAAVGFCLRLYRDNDIVRDEQFSDSAAVNRSTMAISRNSKSGAPSSPLSPRKSAANNSREPFAAPARVYIRSRECRRRQSCVPE
ncbi:hypothetical protein FIBSPDRAFT_1040724 [Athelia psychrophila]|uniref:Uncharacterized protein n=1 Tax=Athelia psychrophila TaxID=1759441 RepID=A0A166PU11_9AGAM|nr:hypothetical protein FIBSPDRAFT_1040724 [Fibularhizoctonia sp. CBS 109695]